MTNKKQKTNKKESSTVTSFKEISTEQITPSESTSVGYSIYVVTRDGLRVSDKDYQKMDDKVSFSRKRFLAKNCG